MSDNPYQSPQTAELAVESPADRLRKTLEIVHWQRGMMWLFLAKFVMNSMAATLVHFVSEPVLMLFFCVDVLIELTVAYYAFRLSSAFYGVGPAIVTALACLPPCLGALTILILNGNVIDRLRKLGVKVGFMGADRPQLEELAKQAQSDPTAAINTSFKD